jgi:uncharacterized membrane protein HdeD (DUF308 family)
MLVLAYIAAILNIILGILAVILPERVGNFIGISASGDLGVSEIRATYGGLFIGLGTASLLENAGFFVLGSAWCCAGIARVVSMLIDKSRSWKMIAGVLMEISMGLLFFSARF